MKGCAMNEIGKFRELGQIPPETILTRKGLADLMNCHPRTIKRMEERGELPAAIRFHGSLCYIAKAIVDHLQHLTEKAQQAALRDRRRLGMEGA